MWGPNSANLCKFGYFHKFFQSNLPESKEKIVTLQGLNAI